MLLAYHGDPKIKKTYEDRVEAHRKADQIIKGTYGAGSWNNGGKGCAVGCTIHGHNHKRYETELGIPRLLAQLEDRIFEGAPVEWAVKWPGRFLAAIPVGADLSNIWPQFASWLLVDKKAGVVKYAKTEKSIAAIRAVAEAYKRDEKDKDVWWKLRGACADADDADAAAYAAFSAYAAASASSDASAASYAADAADAAASYVSSDAADAKQNAFERQGEKLLELLASAPVPALKP